jgi:hypothetical protein
MCINENPKKHKAAKTEKWGRQMIQGRTRGLFLQTRSWHKLKLSSINFDGK